MNCSRYGGLFVKRVAVLAAVSLLVGCAGPKSQTTTSSNPSHTPSSTATQTAAERGAETKFHADELAHVVGIRVSYHGIGSKTTTDPTLLRAVTSILARAKTVEKTGGPTDGPGDTGYLVDLKLDDGQYIPLQYWAGGRSPNLFDIQKQKHWFVDGLDQAMKSVLPPKYLSLEDVRTIGKRIDPNADWWPRFANKASFKVDGDQVWLAVGITQDGKRLALYLDPVTGKVLKEEPPETTDGAVAVVKEFYHLTAQGNYKSAWNLIHSIARQPNPVVKPEQIREKFLALDGQSGPTLVRIRSSAWSRDYWKFYECQCMIFDVVGVNVELSNGTKNTVHVARDRDGLWRLFWSAREGLR